MKRIKIFLLVLCAFLFFASDGWAKMQKLEQNVDGLKMQRTTPESVYLNQKFWVSISLENNSSRDVTIELTEQLGNADFDQSQAKHVETDYGTKFWYYQWKASLPAEKRTMLAYWLVPKQLGAYIIPPAEFLVDGGAFKAQSEQITIRCRPDSQCDLSTGENYLTCPKDCQTGIKDGLCDFARDNKCDPDCQQKSDADCIKAKVKAPLGKSFPNVYYYLAAGGLIILLAGAIKLSSNVLKTILYLLIVIFILLIPYFLLPFSSSLKKFLFPFTALFGLLFFIFGISLFLLAKKEKGELKTLLRLTGISAASPFIFTILHNLFYGLEITFKNLKFLFEGLHGVSFVIVLIIAPLMFIVGAVGSMILFKRQSRW